MKLNRMMTGLAIAALVASMAFAAAPVERAISGLSAASALAGADLVPVVQGGVTKKATVTQIATAAGAVVTKYKAADTTRTSTQTPAEDPDLAYASLAAGTYALNAYVVYTSTTGAAFAGGIKASQALNTSICSSFVVTQTSGAIGTPTTENPRSNATASNQATDGTNYNAMHIRCTLILPSTTTISFHWAQTSSTAVSTKVLAGSWLKIEKIS